MAEKLSRTRAKRGGNSTVMTQLMNEADGLLKAEPSDKKRLKAIATSLKEKLNLVKTLDEEIIENCAVEEVEAEIEESDEINSRVDLLRVINGATVLLKHILSYFKKVYFRDRFIVCNYFNARCLRT